MIVSRLKRSISAKMGVLVGASIFLALFLNGVSLLVYDVKRYQRSFAADLESQAELIGRATTPALEFDDPAAASQNLSLLSIRPTILAAELFDLQGRPFAEFRARGYTQVLPTVAPTVLGTEINGNEARVMRSIRHGERPVGSILILARFRLGQRIADYLLISGTVTAGSLIVALILSFWLQRAITRPIIAIAEVARRIMSTRDFRLQAPVRTADEVGYLANSFNAMIREVEARSNDLIEADRKKDEFLATLAHELRNPLSPLRNGLDIIRLVREKRTPGAEAATLRAEAMMDRQIQQISRLVDDLLDVSRISTGKLLLKSEPVALHGVIRSALDTVDQLYRTRNQALAVTEPTEEVVIFADATRISQIMINLLSNAAKYTPAGGHIQLDVIAKGSDLTVVVTDDGIGIAPDARSRIFEMFHQLDTSLGKEEGGLGVGLHLTRKLVELHGGTIGVESGGVGQGSRFTIRMPVVVSIEPERLGS